MLVAQAHQGRFCVCWSPFWNLHLAYFGCDKSWFYQDQIAWDSLLNVSVLLAQGAEWQKEVFDPQINLHISWFNSECYWNSNEFKRIKECHQRGGPRSIQRDWKWKAWKCMSSDSCQSIHGSSARCEFCHSDPRQRTVSSAKSNETLTPLTLTPKQKTHNFVRSVWDVPQSKWGMLSWREPRRSTGSASKATSPRPYRSVAFAFLRVHIMSTNQAFSKSQNQDLTDDRLPSQKERYSVPVAAVTTPVKGFH